MHGYKFCFKPEDREPSDTNILRPDHDWTHIPDALAADTLLDKWQKRSRCTAVRLGTSAGESIVITITVNMHRVFPIEP